MSAPFVAVADRLASSLPDKLRPAKATVLDHGLLVQRSALRLVNDVQWLVYRDPPAVHLLAQWAGEFRRGLPSQVLYLAYPEEPMAPRPADSPDADARASARRLIDLIQVFTPARPRVVQAVERCVSEVLAEEARHRIWDRLERLTPKHVATLEAAAIQLEAEQDTARAVAED